MPAPKVWVTGLTVGAIAAVTVLAVQADKGTKPHAATARPSVSAQPKPTKTAPPAPVPDGSGTGRRIVYSVGQKRVWLVDASDAARRTVAVWPGTITPDPGTYTVGGRTEGPLTGSDGVKIEHVMYFALKSGISVAFSSAVDGSSPPPASGIKTGGIRMGTADSTAVWTFGTTGTKVTVVD